MATIRILSGGAAQAVVEKLAVDFQRATGHEFSCEFSAVGAMREKLLAGDPADIMILTAALIDGLIESGHVAPRSRADLGRVGTGVAVRAGTPMPNVSNAKALRGNILAATVIACPDPAVATAGKVVMAMLDKLGIADEVRDRMKFFPNGYAAMRWLGNSSGKLEMGITQVTEILPNAAVALAGQLPADLQTKTIYAAGLVMNSSQPYISREFIVRLTASEAQPLLAAAGYEFSN